MSSPVIAEKRSSHIAIADKPDLCQVGNSVCAFISFATLDQAKDLRGNPLPTQGQGYPVFHMGSYVPNSQGNAGVGIRSGGHSGPFNPQQHSDTVRSQGEYQVHDGHVGQINCAAPGTTNGNTTAVVHCGSTGGGDVDVCITKLKLQLQNLKEKIKAEWNNNPSGFLWNAGRGVGSGVQDTGAGMAEGLWDTVTGVASGTWDVITDPVGHAQSAYQSLSSGAGQVYDLGKALYDGDLTVDDIIDGFSDALMNALGSAACSVADELQKMLNEPDGGAHGLGYLLGQVTTYVAVAVATEGAGAAVGSAGEAALGSQRVAALAAKADELSMKAGESLSGFFKRLKARRVRHHEEPELEPEAVHGKGGSSNDGRAEVPGCKVVCATVGHPVNPIYGCKFLAGPEDLDFSLPGLPAIAWQRSYFSDIARVGPFGQGWTLPYDQSIEKSVEGYTLVDAQGRRVPLPSPVVGEPRWVGGEGLLFSRLRDGSLLLVDSLGQRMTYAAVRPDCWRLSSIADGYRNTLLLHWDPTGLLAAVSSDAQRRVELQYVDTPAGRRASAVYEIIGRSKRRQLAAYRYTPDGDLAQVYDRAGNLVREFEWRNHVMVMHRQPGGIESRYEYDVYEASGKVVRNWDSLGGEWRLIYRDGETRVVDNLRRSTRYRYDRARRLTGTVDAEGREASFQLDRDGNLLVEVDGAGSITRYANNGNGMPILITRPDGSQTFVEYDRRFPWLPVAVTDAEGNVSEFDYDDRGGLVAETDALGGRTEYRRDGRGLVIEICDARGGVKRLRYAADGQLVSRTDCSGSETRLEYDDGHLSAVIDAMGKATRYAHDAGGRVKRIEYADGAAEHFSYDGLGRLTSHSDANAATTRYVLAPDGLPIARINALGHSLQYRYDAARRLAELINENGARYGFAYDPLDRLVEEKDFDGAVTRYRYGAADHVEEKEELGQPHAAPDGSDLIRTRFQRDAAGRIVEVSAGHARAREHVRARYAYDGLGRLVKAVNSAAVLDFRYDALGRLVQESSLVAGVVRATRHEYDELGNRIRTVLPDGQVLNRLYYGSGHLHQINLDGDVITDIERDALHRPVTRTHGVLESQYHYDDRGRLAAQNVRRMSHVDGLPGRNPRFRPARDSVAVPVIARQYQYDRTGAPLAIRDARFGTDIYTYDAIGRLTQANEERFAFDPASNIVDVAAQGRADASALIRPPRPSDGFGQAEHPFDMPQDDAPPPPGTVVDNRVRVYNGNHYAYDAHGNLVEMRIGADTVMRFEYDPLHRMVAAEVQSRGNGQRYRYGYDALGRRVFKHADVGLTRFLWDGDALLAETRMHGTRVYVYGEDTFVPIAQIEMRAVVRGMAQSILHYHTDHIGTPRALTREDGTLAWRARYWAWGGVRLAEDDGPDTVETMPALQPLRFQGQYYDEETGLHYNRYRHYDPAMGRFISKDPIGLAGGTNVYQYAPNPVRWIDPLGLERIKNAIDGARREDVFNANMRARNPSATIQCQCYLRNAEGKSVKDPLTGERRRIDTSVIENGRAQTYEVTSPTADKTLQSAKEQRILDAGGKYIRNRNTGDLVPVNGLSKPVLIP